MRHHNVGVHVGGAQGSAAARMVPDVFFTDLMEGDDGDGDELGDSESSGIGGDVRPHCSASASTQQPNQRETPRQLCGLSPILTGERRVVQCA